MIAGRGTALVCFDGSSDEAVALRVAARLFPHQHAQVVHVWRPRAPEGARLPKSSRTWRDSGTMVAEVADVLDTVGSGVAEAVAAEGVALAAAASWSAKPVLQRSEGGFGFDVLRLADEREAAVIVVGARGLTRVNAPLGSVSDAVVNLSRRPVLLVRSLDGGQDVPAEGPVVIAYDGSACAQTAIASAGRLLGPRSALVVHVASLRDREDRSAGARELREPPSTPEAVAADGVQRARAAGFDAAGRVERLTARIWRRSVWNARRTIVDIAERERAAVVVVGARGRSAAQRLLVGSVASGVLQQSGRPVLVVPAPRRARKG